MSLSIRANTHLFLRHVKLPLGFYGMGTLLLLQTSPVGHHLSQHSIEKDLYLDLSILRSSCQHFCISTEAHAQHCIIHHHEVILCLILQILNKSQFIGQSSEINELYSKAKCKSLNGFNSSCIL